MSDLEETERSVKSHSLRHGKNSKHHDEKPEKKKQVKKHEKKSKDDHSSSSSSDSEDKKKKKHKKPHSLLNKHKTDPSDLLDNQCLEQNLEQNPSNLTVCDTSLPTELTTEPIPIMPGVDIDLDPILISPLPPPVKLIPTAAEHVAEFYAQLKFLDEFFKSEKITYWLNGGTLLGQVRNAMLIPWADCNSLGVEDVDGKRVAKELRAAAKKLGYDLWNNVHGLKLRTSKSPVSTDIYFYSRLDKTFVLSDRSRKQWPKDYFSEDELVNPVDSPFGPLMLTIPRNANRYLATLYGEDFLYSARYSSFDHFTGQSRPLPLIVVKLV